MSEEFVICDRCGEECGIWGDDALDNCPECGIVEGNTHIEVIEEEL